MNSQNGICMQTEAPHRSMVKPMNNQIRKSLDEFSDESDQFETQFQKLITGEGDESTRDELMKQIVQWLKDGAGQGRFLPLASAERRAFRSILERWSSRLRSQAHYIEGIDYLADFDPDAGVALTVECPYPGLEPYTRDQQSSFFGRELLVSQSVEHLQEQGNRILLIIGASGSGKSSIAMAGILPRLEDLHGNEWLFAPRLTPGERPLEALAASVSQAIDDPDKAQEIKRSLADQPNEALGQMAVLCGDKPLMLLIDQFEEMLTLCRDESEKQTFAQVLQALSDPTNSNSNFSCRILLTLRTDHLARLESDKASQLLHKRLVKVENLCHLSAIGFNDIKRAIKTPADKIGLRFIPAGLIDQLASQTAGLANGLPLLQFALRRLWETRPRNESGKPLDLITEEMMRKLPDVERALGTVAEGIFHEFSDQQKKICERLLMELLVLDENLEVPLRRRRRETDLRMVLAKFSEPDDVDRVTDQFVSTGLLRRFGEGKAGQLEVAHEALLRNWDHIYRIISGVEAKERLLHVKKIGREAIDWVNNDNSSDLLKLQGKWLQSAIDYANEGWIVEEATEYVNACRLKEEAEGRKEKEIENAKIRARWYGYAVLGVLLFSAIIIVLILMNKNKEMERIAHASDLVSYGFYYLYQPNHVEIENAEQKFREADKLGQEKLLLAKVARGLTSYNKKDFNNAKIHFDNAISLAQEKEKHEYSKKDPVLYTYYYNKGKACNALNFHDEARDSFEEAISLIKERQHTDDKLSEYHYLLGISHLHLRDFENAEKELNLWRKSSGANDAFKWYELGDLYLRQGSIEAALNQFEKASSLAKDNYEASATMLAEKHDKFQFNLGVAFVSSGDWTKSAKVFQYIVEKNPMAAAAWLYLTQAYVFFANKAKENKQDEIATEWSIKGERAAKKALSISDLAERDRPKAHTLLGDSLVVRGKYEQAIEAYSEARDRNPEDAFLALYIAGAYYESKNRTKGKEYMQLAEKLAKNDRQLENEDVRKYFDQKLNHLKDKLRNP